MSRSDGQPEDGMEFHEPVLLNEILERFGPLEKKVIVDGTAGSGGHCVEFLKRIGPEGFLIGLDRDPEVLEIARKRFERELPGTNRILANRLYEEMPEVLAENGFKGADCILLDLGINSLQLENPERGFSFSKDGPLDGRFNPQETSTRTVSDIVNNATQEELSQIIRDYSDERMARPIARRIVEERQNGPVDTTLKLAELVRYVYPPKKRFDRIHPATRTFQALRIAANEELSHVETGIEAALGALAPGGVLCVISFHSLEDRITKKLFDRVGSPRVDPSNLYAATTTEGLEYQVESRGAAKATSDETQSNPRARSARLRTIRRLNVSGKGTEQ